MLPLLQLFCMLCRPTCLVFEVNHKVEEGLQGGVHLDTSHLLHQAESLLSPVQRLSMPGGN